MQIDDAEALWQAQHITNYRITVTTSSSRGGISAETTVQNGTVVDQTVTCLTGETTDCNQSGIVSENYTVPNLFAMAREMSGGNSPLAPQYFKVTFDPAYGFPSSGSYDHPDTIDEEWGWTVNSFDVLGDLTVQLDEAEAAWQALHITDYTLTMVSASMWTGITVTTTVQGGIITDQEVLCDPSLLGEATGSDCAPDEPEDFTVPGLFATARETIQTTEFPEYFGLVFDPVYYFPSSASYDYPEAIDEEWGWWVKSFEVLGGIGANEEGKAETLWHAMNITDYQITIRPSNVGR
jgi:hypothetical protein